MIDLCIGFKTLLVLPIISTWRNNQDRMPQSPLFQRLICPVKLHQCWGAIHIQTTSITPTLSIVRHSSTGNAIAKQYAEVKKDLLKFLIDPYLCWQQNSIGRESLTPAGTFQSLSVWKVDEGWKSGEKNQGSSCSTAPSLADWFMVYID